MIKSTQMSSSFKDIINDQVYQSTRKIENRSAIPDTSEIPIEDQLKWLKVPDVICVFVDMMGSTRLSAESYDRSTAGAYQLFTVTTAGLFHEFESPYIDVRADEASALFDATQFRGSCHLSKLSPCRW